MATTKRVREDTSSSDSDGDSEDGPLPGPIKKLAREERENFRWYHYWSPEKGRWRNVNDDSEDEEDGSYFDYNQEKWVHAPVKA